MVSDIIKEQCCGCGACANICPKQCITMEEDAEGFRYPKIDSGKCVECGLCNKVCIAQKEQEFRDAVPKAFAAYNLNENIRLNSSSGGIFTLFAEHILQQGGLVAGVKFDNEFNAVFSIAENKEELQEFRGSKYIQSDTRDIFKRVENELQSGRKVLFVGTPCQVNALYYFLKKEYDNLYLIDFICHGVPSPHIWREYINSKESQKKAKLRTVSFRDKKSGWKNYHVNMQFVDGSVYDQVYQKETYMRGFLSDLYLRPSCYQCQVKGVEKRKSDITIADFWGAQNILPQEDDDKGMSLAILYTTKGSKMLESISGQAWIQEVVFEEVVRYNPSYFKAAKFNRRRQHFFATRDNKIENRILKEIEGNFVRRGVRRIKKFLKR